MTTTYKVLKPIYYPAVGHVPPFGQRCAPEHEVAPEVGTVVDLSHLRDVALEFFLRNGCVEAVEEGASPANTEEGGK